MDLKILDEAAAVVRDRQAKYGRPEDNHRDTAALWSVFLGVRVTARQVCLMNILQKISRERCAPARDNLVDIAGYAQNASGGDDASEGGA